MAEALISVLLVGVVLAGTTAAAMSALRSVSEAKAFQQATEIGNEMVEDARDLDYGRLYMETGDLSGDPRVLPGYMFDPDGDESRLDPEPLVHAAAGGSIVPHITTRTIGGRSFTVRRYVTEPQSGVAEGLRRLTVIVTWQAGGRTATYTTSALIARARRGLPVPKFRLDQFPPEDVMPGHQLVVPYTVKNRGIVDAYEISFTVSRSWAASLHLDSDGNGLFDPVVDPTLTDTNGNGTVDTGNVGTDETVGFFFVYDVPSTEPTGEVTISLRAVSGADPTQDDEETATITVGSAGTTLYLHNGTSPLPPPNRDTRAVNNMSMSIDVPSATVLYRYSTDLYNPPQPERGGRLVREGGNASTEEVARRANWAWQVPSPGVTLDGTARADLWVAQKDFGCLPLRFTVYLRSRRSMTKTNGSFAPQPISSRTVDLPAGDDENGECRWRHVTVDLPVTATSVPQGYYLELKVTVTAPPGGVLFAYDTVSFPASLYLPTVAR